MSIYIMTVSEINFLKYNKMEKDNARELVRLLPKPLSEELNKYLFDHSKDAGIHHFESNRSLICGAMLMKELQEMGTRVTRVASRAIPSASASSVNPVVSACVNSRGALVHSLASTGDVGSLMILQESGLDLSIMDHLGRTAMHHAALGGQTDTMDYLARTVGLSISDRSIADGQSPLEHAIRLANEGAVTWLCDNGAVESACSSESKTLLFHAVEFDPGEDGLNKICRDLVSKMSLEQVDRVDSSGYTAIMRAAEDECFGCVEAILTKDSINLNIVNLESETLLDLLNKYDAPAELIAQVVEKGAQTADELPAIATV